MSSWAADIEATRRGKNYADLASSKPEELKRPKPIRNTHMNREYDIVSFKPLPETRHGRVVDTAKPDKFTRAASHHSPTERFQKGVQNEFKHSYNAYNAVTHKPKYGLSEEEATSKFPSERHRGVRPVGEFHERTFDLVSNTALSGKEERFDAEEKAAADHKVRYAPRQRQTDIVSHRFKKDHEERFAQQQEENRQRLEARKKPTDFNPVLQKWNDQRVETEKSLERERKQEQTRENVRNHTYKVSSLVRQSEGHAVDFLTNRVHNPEFLLEIEKQKVRGTMQRTKQRQEFEHRRDMEEAIREADVNLVLQRHHPSKKPEFAGGEKVPSTLARLEAAMKTKPATNSQVFLAEGPRTSHERVLNVKPSEIAAAANTYEGRKKILMPTLAKAAGRPLSRDELLGSLHFKQN